MVSPFSAALAQFEADLDSHLGEDIAIVLMRSGEFAAAPDPDRPAFDVKGLVRETEPSSTAIAGIEARIAYEELEIEIRWAVLPGKIRKNDEVILLDRPHVPRCKVNRVDRLDEARIVLTVGPVAGD